MIHQTPRHSYGGSLRASVAGTREYDSVGINADRGATMVPAYSVTSEIVACGFAAGVGGNEGALFARRIPGEADGKEATSMKVTGGCAWCPTNDKFYHGCAALNQPTGDGMAVVMDPLLDMDAEVITGFSGVGMTNGGRTMFHPTQLDIWMQWGPGGHGFARIDPATNAVSYVSCSTPLDFTYCSSDDCVYYSNAGQIVKVNGAGAATVLYTTTDFQTSWGSPTPGASFGSIEYVDSIDRVLFMVSYPSGGYFFAWQVDPSTGTVSPYASSVAGQMYYTPQFDRIILYAAPNLFSYEPDFGSHVTLGFNGTGTDQLSGAKGCYCDNVDKIALPVLTGPPGERFYTLNFYGAAEL